MTTSRSLYKIHEVRQHLSPRDFDVLRSLETFRLLTTGQVRRLHFLDHVSESSAARTTVRVLGRLESHRLIVRLSRRIGGFDKGSAANVWQLAALGERLLRALADDPSRRRYVEPTEGFTRHTLAVAELAVRATEHSRRGGFELLNLETEPDCWRTSTRPDGTIEWLKPDLFMVTANADYEAHAFIEVDRDTEHMPAILRKCTKYQRYWRSGIEQARSGLFPAVVWIVPTVGRADRIRAAIRGEPTLSSDLFQVVTDEQALSVLGPEPSTNPDPTSSNRKEESL